MLDTVGRYLGAVSNPKDTIPMMRILEPIATRYSSQALNSAGLVIKAGGGVLAKTGAADFYAVVQGILVKIAASTDMPALTGINITAGAFNVVIFFVDSAGALTALPGIQGATLGAVRFPQFPAGKAAVGMLLITYASAFTGGTTPLDTATTIFLSPTGAFDPTVLV